ncbi:uncharacterized protein LOC111621967 isoform X2 [Centruroides sculpturatus]|nr:uncharacterized protein LOC111621967 isoform X2 [Centruroides sculpturatus]
MFFKLITILFCIWIDRIETETIKRDAGNGSLHNIQFNNKGTMKNSHPTQFQNLKYPFRPWKSPSFNRFSYESHMFPSSNFDPITHTNHEQNVENSFDLKAMGYPATVNNLPTNTFYENGGYVYNNGNFKPYENILKEKYDSMKNTFSIIRKKFQEDESLTILLGLFPAALLLASLMPNFIVIPMKRISTASEPAKAGQDVVLDRQRRHSLLGNNPAFRLDKRNEPPDFDRSNCLKRFICQSARQGRKNKENVIQKTLYQLVSKFKTNKLSLFSLKSLLEAIKGNKCYIFQCPFHENEILKRNKKKF